MRFQGVDYGVDVTRAAEQTRCPPLLALPPIGVGVTRAFYQPLAREWKALGAPSELHAPELLGNGDATPKKRVLYTPEMYAEQLTEYMRSEIRRPAVLIVQGGLLPVALEMWRIGGDELIAGLSLASPPAVRFISPEAPAETGVRRRFRAGGGRGRGRQRALWLLAQSTAGGFFFRYLRGADGERIRSFSERNLFGRAENVDEEWMRMCRDGAADTRSRHATFAYLCGTVPGGSWRYDRKALLNAIDVPCQVIRGGSAEGAAERLEAFVDEVQSPSCCALVDDGRAVIPYEQSFEYATLLGRFLAINYEPDLQDAVTARSARRRSGRSAPDRETA